MLRELIEYANSIKEEMKVTLSEIKKHPQGINSEGKEAGIQIDDLKHEEISSTRTEETRIQNLTMV